MTKEYTTPDFLDPVWAGLYDGLKHAVEVIERHVAEDALGRDPSEGWSHKDEYLYYMRAALTAADESVKGKVFVCAETVPAYSTHLITAGKRYELLPRFIEDEDDDAGCIISDDGTVMAITTDNCLWIGGPWTVIRPGTEGGT